MCVSIAKDNGSPRDSSCVVFQPCAETCSVRFTVHCGLQQYSPLSCRQLDRLHTIVLTSTNVDPIPFDHESIQDISNRPLPPTARSGRRRPHAAAFPRRPCFQADDKGHLPREVTRPPFLLLMRFVRANPPTSCQINLCRPSKMAALLS